MIWAKAMAFLGLYLPQPPDNPALSRAMRRASIASVQHAKIADRARDAALNIFHQQETDSRPAEMRRDTEVLKETIERNSTTTIEALLREMQGK